MANAEYFREWRKLNPGKTSEYSKQCRERTKKKDPLYYIKRIYRERKRTAGLRGIPFTITIEDIAQVPTHCPVLGIELQSGKGSNNPNAASLDRIQPEIGYVPGNVCWMSFRANRLKGDGAIEELESLLTWMRKQNGCLRSS